MRLVQVTVPTGKRDAILDALDDEGVDYVVTDEASGRGYTAVVYFPLPPPAVQPVLDRLREAGLPDDAYTTVLNAETVISRRFERLRDRYEEEEEDSGPHIARSELTARVRSFIPSLGTYSLMVIASALIATAGVLLDSAAVVVGSMVIAPLIGPAMATSLGTVLGNRELFVRGTRLQVIGALVAVAAAAVFAAFVRTLNLVPPGIDVTAIGQVRERLDPDFLSLVIALGAGVAGAYSLSTGVSTALVGVMIAAALVPPIAVIGIGVAWGRPSMVIGSTVLVLVNFVSINLAALLVLWYQGYRPGNWFQEDEARSRTVKRVAFLTLTIVVLSAFLGGVTYSSFQTATVADEIQGEVRGVIDEEYPALSVLEVRIVSERRTVFVNVPFTREPTGVVVTVGRPPGEQYPDLIEDLSTRINRGRDLAVEVRFVDRVTRTPSAQPASAAN